jgi:hypothetical protein
MANKRKRTKKAEAAFCILLLLVLPVLYVASAGPVAMLVMSGTVERETYNYAYAPVAGEEERSNIVGRVMGWWRGLFVDESDWKA